MSYLKKEKRKKHKFKRLVIFFLFTIILLLVGFFGNHNFLIFSFPKISSKQKLVTPLSSLDATEKLKKDLEFLGIKMVGEPEQIKDEVVVTLSSGTRVFFKKKEDYSSELDSLQLILRNIRIEGKWPLKIDLRFKRPVLGF